MKTSILENSNKTLIPKKGHVFVLRTCDAAMKAYGGFQWKTRGVVSAPDWKPKAKCGNGLHGLKWGVGDGSLLDWSEDAKWLVVEVKESEIVDLAGKIKFPSCRVVYCGDRLTATAILVASSTNASGVVGATITAGDSGTATAGYRGTATAGDSGTATAGYSGTATAGDRGTATAGDSGTATAGDSGTATAGDSGTATAGYSGTATAGDRGTATAGYSGILQIRWYDFAADRYRIATAYVGEKGIEPNVPYRLNDKGKFVKAEVSA